MNKQWIVALPITIVIALTIGLGTGYWYAAQKDHAEMKAMATGPSAETSAPEDKPLFYRNPMNPAITSSVPAKDEMGMDYIPVYANGAGSQGGVPGTVLIDPVTAQNIGIRSAVAKKQVLSRTIRAVGRVDYDEELISKVHPKIEGWVEDLQVTRTGEKVEKDAILLSIYSPQLVTSQQEYVLALKNLAVLQDSPYAEIRQGAQDLVESSRKRLEFLDMPAHQLTDLTETLKVKKNLHIHSPFNGIVMHLGVSVGDYVTPKTQLYMLADLSKVWVYVDVYEYELPWLKIGDEAEITTASVPGKIFKGQVAYIYPYMERKTRTAKIRIELANQNLQLKPEMFANVVLQGGRKITAVVIPAEAVVRSGKRTQVFLVKGEGKFEPREVTLGVSTEGLVQVLQGLEAGEQVVTSSQFLIDSESKLREATAKMLEAMGGAGDDDEMNMDDMTLENNSSGGKND
jgi:Cu(I)/Ag(I) efflux system membrane fusion protein